MELQKNLPDGPASVGNLQPFFAKFRDEGTPKKTNLTPQRNLAPPSSSVKILNISSPQPRGSQKASNGSSAPIGAFWSTTHAQVDSNVNLGKRGSTQNSSQKMPSSNFTQTPKPEGKTTSQNESINTFVADFDSNGLSSENMNRSTWEKEQTEVDIKTLKEQLKQAISEKAEITARCEKLTAICRSQQQAIQVLKKALAQAAPSSHQITPGNAKTTPLSQNCSRNMISSGNTTATPSQQQSKDTLKSQISPGSAQAITPLPPGEKMEKGIWELQQAMFSNVSSTASPAPQQWKAFPEEPEVHRESSLVWPINGHQNSTKPEAAAASTNYSSTPANCQLSRTSTVQNHGSALANQPTGWAAF